MTELGWVGGVLGVRNGSTWMDGTGKDPIGAKGDNGGSDTRGPGGHSEGLLGGRGGVGTLGVLKNLSNVE